MMVSSELSLWEATHLFYCYLSSQTCLEDFWNCLQILWHDPFWHSIIL